MNRKTHFPPTYVVYRKGNDHYLLYWVELGKDGSVYVWFSEIERKLFQVNGRHEQVELTKEVPISVNPVNLYNPHLSYHPSGRVHISGYKDRISKPREHIIEDRITDDLPSLVKRKSATIFCSILSPVLFAKDWASVENIKVEDFLKQGWNYTEITKQGASIVSNSKPFPSVIALDSSLIPPNKILNSELFIHGKGEFDFESDHLKYIKKIIGQITVSNDMAPASYSLQFSLSDSSVEESANQNIHHLVLFNKDCLTVVSLKPVI